jgi:phospholipid/cholesterol/gamma-HCH transport system substrate-binding protein
MKFKMRRFADQIVGVFIIFSLVALAFVIVVLGQYQRWFANDVSYRTVLSSAVGLSRNMAVQYKGFAIGSVKTFYLTDKDDVEVIFSIQSDYKDKVRNGSIVELQVSPIGLGNQFQFYAGKGGVLEEKALIPAIGSAEARELMRQNNLVGDIQRDDSISVLLSRVSSIMGQLDTALGEGTEDTEIGKMIGSLNKTLEGVDRTLEGIDIPLIVENVVADALGMIENLLKPILNDVDNLIAKLEEDGGLLDLVLGTDSEVYKSLLESLNSVSSMLDSLDTTIAFIPSQLPQVAGLLLDLRATLKSAEDVLVSLTNNPLLRGGVPSRVDSQNSDISPRGIRF